MTLKLKVLLFSLVTFLFSCKREKKDYFDAIAVNDVAMSKPQENDWLYQHPEKGQTFQEYENSNPLKVSQNKNTIYILPIGVFSDLQNKAIEETREYLQDYFQLKVIVLPAASDSFVNKTERRIHSESNEQLLSGSILQFLMDRKKNPNEIALMAITEKDIYPKPEWNYVFGQASYKDAVGVTSIFRLENQNLSQSNFNETLLSLMKISSHEIGHMFEMAHCTNAYCVMNGTNGLRETDFHPARLCSVCQRKLFYSVQFNPLKRTQDLESFFEKNNFNRELTLIKKDIDWIN